jgi:starvation-inducible DNA-binding protein
MERKFETKTRKQPLTSFGDRNLNDREFNMETTAKRKVENNGTTTENTKKMNYLNFDLEKAKDTSKELNILLADYHLYYQKLRNYHWNIVGRSFFDLHIKFEEMYNDTIIKIDEVAERILTLRYQPTSNYSDYLKLSNIKESKSELSDVEMVLNLIEDHGIILTQLAKVVKTAGDCNDEGTIDLIGAYIRELETTTWMLDAWRMNTGDIRKSI